VSGTEWNTPRRDEAAGDGVPAEPAISAGGPPPIPPPVFPGGAPESAGSPPPGRPRAKWLAGLGVVAAVVAGIALKFVLPLVIGSAIGSAFSGAFGGPWEKLPSDVRAGFEQRLETASAGQLKGLSDAQTGSKIEGWLTAGMPRLDDARLVRHLELLTQSLDQADEATCAAFGRHSVNGAALADDASEKLIGTLDQAALIEWIGLNVDAIEAELRGSPEAKVVSATESDAVLNRMVASMTEADLTTIGALSSGQTLPDAQACAAIRSLYGTTRALDPADKVVMARFDVQP
jgi:hypothetical protein